MNIQLNQRVNKYCIRFIIINVKLDFVSFLSIFCDIEIYIERCFVYLDEVIIVELNNVCIVMNLQLNLVMIG